MLCGDNRQFLSFFTFLLVFSIANGFNITILHTNDVHSRFMSYDERMRECTDSSDTSKVCYGGAARRLTLVKEIRTKYGAENVLMLDGGDHFQGTLWYTIAKWQPVADMVNLFHYDAMAFGNHEFDDGLIKNDSVLGPIGLAPYLAAVKTPFIAANVDSAPQSPIENLYKKSIVIERSGQKIGIVGYVTPETSSISLPGPSLTINEEVASLTVVTNQMKAQGINKIIAIGHSGYEMDKKICAQVPGVDIVVGGHTNTFLYSGPEPTRQKAEGLYPTQVQNVDGHTCLTVQDFAYGKYLGFLQVAFDEQGNLNSWSGNPIVVNNTIREDPEMVSTLTKYKTRVDEFRGKVIGKTATKLTGNWKICRVSECTFGNLFTDAMVFSYLKKRAEAFETGDTGGTTPAGWAPSAIAIMNSAAFRDIELEPWSNITMADLFNTIPYANTVEKVKLKGRHLLETLERSVEDLASNRDDPHGKFLQVSGMKVEYDLKRPKGQQVVRVMVKCSLCDAPVYENLQPDHVYNIIVTSFLKKGGDGYASLARNLFDADGLETLDIDVVADYVKSRSPVVIGLEGRIRFVDSSKNECPQ